MRAVAASTGRLKTGIRMAAIGVALCAAGFGLLWVWPPIAVALAMLGAVATFMAGGTANVGTTRLAGQVGALLYALTVYRASGSVLLGAAGGVPLLAFGAVEPLVPRIGYKAGRLFPLFVVAGLALLAAAWPFGWWGLAVVPPLFLVGFMSLGVARGLGDMKRHTPARWPAAIGDTAPSVRATTRDGGAFDLAEERGRWVMLCFLRGDWCAVCQIMMRTYKKHAAVLAQHNVKLVAVSPSGGPEAQEFAHDLGLDYAILADTDLAVARAFGALHPKSAPGGGDTALPVSFLVDPQGVIRAATRSEDPASYQSPLSVLALVH